MPSSQKNSGISPLSAAFRALRRHLRIPTENDYDLAYVAAASDRIDLEMRIRERSRSRQAFGADRSYSWKI